MRSCFEDICTRWLPERLHSETGATSVEYAILVSLIAAAIALVVLDLGGQVQLLFQSATKGW